MGSDEYMHRFNKSVLITKQGVNKMNETDLSKAINQACPTPIPELLSCAPAQQETSYCCCCGGPYGSSPVKLSPVRSTWIEVWENLGLSNKNDTDEKEMIGNGD